MHLTYHTKHAYTGGRSRQQHYTVWRNNNSSTIFRKNKIKRAIACSTLDQAVRSAATRHASQTPTHDPDLTQLSLQTVSMVHDWCYTSHPYVFPRSVCATAKPSPPCLPILQATSDVCGKQGFSSLISCSHGRISGCSHFLLPSYGRTREREKKKKNPVPHYLSMLFVQSH